MGARRSLLIWWGAGAVLLLLLAAWVFRASLNEQRRPHSSFGANGFDRPGDARAGMPQNVDSNGPNNNPALDPHVQETLRTINEINRLNKMNQDLRTKPADKPVLPASPLPPTKPKTNTAQDEDNTSSNKR